MIINKIRRSKIYKIKIKYKRNNKNNPNNQKNKDNNRKIYRNKNKIKFKLII